MDKIDEVKAELSEEEDKSKSKLEVAARYIARVAPVLGPVVVSGGITEACIIGAQVLSLTEIAMLSGTVGYLIANRKELEEAINELPGGKEALEKVKSKRKNRGHTSQLRRQDWATNCVWTCGRAGCSDAIQTRY